MTAITEVQVLDDTVEEIRTRMNKEAVTAQIDEFIEVISSSGFIDFVNDIAAQPTYDARRELMAENAHLGTLEEYGVPVPDGLRLTTREFEMPQDGKAAQTPLVKVTPGLDPRMGACVSIGYIVCASYGS